jgi:hypothetical protein
MKYPCNCFFCSKGSPHPDRGYHTEFMRITSQLLKSESLDPNDSIDLEACTICSHVRVVPK